MGDLSPHFSSWEFKCRCGREECPVLPPIVSVSETLIQKLEVARTDSDLPFVITSGLRCDFWNEKIGGSKESAHVEGKAADILCQDGSWRMIMLTAFINAGFNRIGIGKDFIHVDVSERHPRPRIWLY